MRLFLIWLVLSTAFFSSVCAKENRSFQQAVDSALKQVSARGISATVITSDGKIHSVVAGDGHEGTSRCG